MLYIRLRIPASRRKYGFEDDQIHTANTPFAGAGVTGTEVSDLVEL